jgi:membrane-associated protease RseP (regulator of RpoE activity)
MTDDSRIDPVDPTPPRGDRPDLESSATETPTVDTPVTATPVDATAPAGGEGPPPWQAAPTPASSPTPRSSISVPIWAVIAVAGIFLFGLGLLGGGILAGGDGHSHWGHHEWSSAAHGRAPFGERNGAGLGPDRGRHAANGSREGSPGTTRATTAYLGVASRDASNQVGAAVVQVAPSSPAARAGLEDGDVITAIGSTTVRDAAQLSQAVHTQSSGDQVTVAYARGGADHTVAVRLGSRSPVQHQ